MGEHDVNRVAIIVAVVVNMAPGFPVVGLLVMGAILGALGA